MLLTKHAMRWMELSAIKKLAMHQRYILGDKFICVHATGDGQLSLLWPNPTWRIWNVNKDNTWITAPHKKYHPDWPWYHPGLRFEQRGPWLHPHDIATTFAVQGHVNGKLWESRNLLCWQTAGQLFPTLSFKSSWAMTQDDVFESQWWSLTF